MLLCELNRETAATREQLHQTLARELQLPEWYGANLDALYDVLTAETRPVKLEIWSEQLWETLGDYAEVLLRLCVEAAGQNPSVRVEIRE